MRRTSLADMHCSVARTVDVIGEWWTPLIVRDAFYGRRRFEDFQRSLGLARNVLAARLERLVETGIMERVRYQEHPPRDEYVLTEKGRDLFPVIAALLAWGDKWTAGPAGPPLLLIHEPCGQPGTLRATCDRCGEPMGLDSIRPTPGPGA
jgi:DNA-binding HxlR family transcriptional regulator